MLQPNYLTFSELLARWNCEAKQVHTFIQDRFLQPSIIWNDNLVVCEWQSSPADETLKDLVELDALNPPKKLFDSHLVSIKGNWLNLIFPRRTGAYQYEFRYIVLGKAGFNDGDQWYRLAYYDDVQTLCHKNIDQIDVEKMAVFMRDVVKAFEENHPNDLAKSIEDVNQKKIGRRKAQLETILAIIAELGFKPLKIPDGGKTKIKNICLKSPKLFSDSAFGHAWKVGLEKNLFKLENAEKYKP